MYLLWIAGLPLDQRSIASLGVYFRLSLLVHVLPNPDGEPVQNLNERNDAEPHEESEDAAHRGHVVEKCHPGQTEELGGDRPVVDKGVLYRDTFTNYRVRHPVSSNVLLTDFMAVPQAGGPILQ